MLFQSQLVIGSKKTQKNYIEKIIDEILGKNNCNSPDLIRVEEVEKKTIGIDKAKDIISLAYKKPYQNKNKIIIIESSHNLTNQAQNSLLKILEEPPQNTLIILLAENINFFLPTVLSRCKIILLGKETTIDLMKIPMSIQEQYKFIDNLKSIKTQKEKRQKIEDLLTSITKNTKEELARTFDKETRKKIEKKLKLISEIFTKLEANVNQRLLLEHLFIELNDF